jgi:hypothetical protein
MQTMMKDEFPHLVYISTGPDLRSNLQAQLQRDFWQTMFRRAVFEHVLGVPERPMTDKEYRQKLKKARDQITNEIVSHFAFRCLPLEDFVFFQKWLVDKHRSRVWNRRKQEAPYFEESYLEIEAKLMASPLILFSEFQNHTETVPDEGGVYMIFRV